MKCFSGITLRATGKTVPCGQCINCRINKGRKWAGRILLEHIYSPHADDPERHDFFLTFTIAPDHIKHVAGGPTLDKKDFLKWWKAHQRKTRKFRYLAVGEYGDLRQRPHYHMVVFGATLEEARTILKDWKKGYTDWHVETCTLNAQRANYICGYTVKKLSKSDPEGYGEGVEPEFRSSTHFPAIGSACVAPMVRRYRGTAGQAVLSQRGDVERAFRYDGKIYPIAPFILGKIRAELGISESAVIREDENPAHLMFHSYEAEQCLEKRLAAERRHDAKTKKANITTIRV